MKVAKSVDFSRAEAEFGRFRDSFPEALFDRLARVDVGVHQQRILDVGTGTGAMARAFARQGCAVTGLDTSEELMNEARRIDERAGLSIAYVRAKAERTGLADRDFDGVSAGRCWHWFKRGKAAREARRLLVPGGWLLIAYFDWLPLPGNVVEATEKLILKYNRRWTLAGSTGLHDRWLTDVRTAGFVRVETFSFDVVVPYSHEAWRGRVRASSGVAASMPRGKVIRFDEKLRSLLAEDYPDEPLAVPHCLWALVCWAPG